MDTIQKEKLYDHPIDKVWKAISNADEISSWFIKADFKPEIGYHYTFTSSEANCTQISGVVKEAHPYRLVYTWVVQHTNVETLVTWHLEEVDGKTRLLLEHSGISGYEGETVVAMFNSFKGGWDNCVSNLENYLNKILSEV